MNVRNLDRTTGKLLNHFCPRFAQPEEHRGSRALDRDFENALSAPIPEDALREKGTAR